MWDRGAPPSARLKRIIDVVAKCEGTLHFVPRSMVHCRWQLRAEALALGHTAAEGLKPWSGCAPCCYRIVQPPTFLSFVCEGPLLPCTPKGVRQEISYINTVSGFPTGHQVQPAKAGRRCPLRPRARGQLHRARASRRFWHMQRIRHRSQ